MFLGSFDRYLHVQGDLSDYAKMQRCTLSIVLLSLSNVLYLFSRPET